MRTTIYTCNVCGTTLTIAEGETFDSSLGWRKVTIDWVLTSFSNATTTRADICSDKCAAEFIEKKLPAFTEKASQK